MVNVFMGEYPRVFFGFSFVYSDGREESFGRRKYQAQTAKHYPCIVQSFGIAGEKGEVILQIETSHSKMNDIVQSISFRTSFNRQRTFRLFGNLSYDDKSSSTISIAPPGQALSNFFVVLKSPDGHIRDLVASFSEVGNRLEEHTSTEMEISLESLPVQLTAANEILAYKGGFAFMAADLSGLRRLHFSIGAQGFSRSGRNMSGLQMEFANSQNPLIVGQWLKKHATLELDTDERLVEITTWHSILNPFSRIKFGPITGVVYVTSKGKRLESPPQGHKDNMVCLKYRENPYEKLAIITWVCNYQWDHVRFLYAPKAEKQPRRLILGPATRQIPIWAVTEKMFTTEGELESCPDPMTSIEVTYKSLSDEPSGLTFLYLSGRVQTIGSRGERPCVRELERGERLTRMDIGILRANRLGSVTVSCIPQS
jgi:hypothetical protein